MTTDLREDIVEMREVFNASTPEEVLAEIDRGSTMGAGELLSREALVHESCMNQRTADAFWALADRLGDV